MRTPAPLPSNLHHQLDSALSDVFEKAWDALGGVDVEESVLESARACVASAARRKHTALAQTARQANDKSSWLSGLPNELWNLVFEHMPFDDFFTATHVCSAWRARALASQHLWARPTFYTYDSGRGIVNIETAPVILARSGALPLDVILEDHATRRMGTCFLALACALYPHTARITRLCVRSGHLDMPNFLLERLGALPALEVFVAQRLPTQDDGFFSTFAFCPKNFDSQLPRLVHLELGRGYIWPVRFPCKIPTIRSLHLTPRKDPDAEIGAALKGCPNLARLHLDLSAFTSMREPRLVNASLRGKASSVACVTIAGIEANSFLADWALATFHNPGRLEFAIESSIANTLRWDVLCEVFTPGAAVQLTVGYSRNNVPTARATADGGRMRSVAIHDCNEPSAPLNVMAQVVAKAGANCKLTVKPDEFCASRFVLPSQ